MVNDSNEPYKIIEAELYRIIEVLSRFDTTLTFDSVMQYGKNSPNYAIKFKNLSFNFHLKPPNEKAEHLFIKGDAITSIDNHFLRYNTPLGNMALRLAQQEGILYTSDEDMFKLKKEENGESRIELIRGVSYFSARDFSLTQSVNLLNKVNDSHELLEQAIQKWYKSINESILTL